MQQNDILISITADVGLIGVVPENFDVAYINQHISLARPVTIFRVKYLAWCLSSMVGQMQFRKLQRGATKAGLRLDDIRSVNVPLPPLAEQEEVVSLIEQKISIIDEIDRNISQHLIRAERLRQSILKKAFAGKLMSRRPTK